MNNDKLYRDAWEKWGPEAQLIMIMEESAELIQAVAKFMRYRDEAYVKPILEEMVDIRIMMNQFLLVFDKKSEYRHIKAVKLDRLTEKVYHE